MGAAMEDGAGRRRRRWLVAAGVLVVVAVGALVVLPRVDGNDSSVAGAGCGDDPGGPAAAVGIDSVTGAEKWHRQVGPLSGQVEAAGTLVTIDRGGHVTGIDLATGGVRWCRQVDDTGTMGAASPQGTLVAAGDVVATMTADGAVVALDPATGAERWKTDGVGSETAGLTSYGGYVFVVSGVMVAVPAAPPATGAPESTTAPTLPPVDVLTVLDPRDGSIAPIDGAPPGPDALVAGKTRVQFPIRYSSGRQEIDVIVSEMPSGPVRWSATLPGFTASIVDDQLVVVDQTGGTGVWNPPIDPPGVDTRLTAYALADGSRRWQAPMSGTPQHAFSEGGLVLVADGPRVAAMEQATGALRWSVDHGSPGTGGDFSEPGTYRWFGATDDGQTVVGIIEAEQPYRD